MALPNLLLSLAVGALVSILYVIATIIYRLTLHPLAKYPGPTLRKITGWPDGLSALRKTRHLDLHKLHSEYGEVVRYAPNRISFNTVDAIRDIYIDRKANMIKTGFPEAYIRIIGSSNTQTSLDEREHAAKRRLLSHVFSEAALRSAEEYMLPTIRYFTEKMSPGEDDEDKWSKPREMDNSFTLMTLDVLGELCFGESFGALKAGKSLIISMLLNSSTLMQTMLVVPGFSLLIPLLRTDKLLQFFNRNMYEKRWGFRKQVIQMVNRRIALEEKAEKEGTELRRDFFSYLIKARDPETGAGISMPDLLAESAMLVAAGTDTTSTALSSTLFYLNRNPTILQKLVAEVRSAFSDLEEIRSGMKISSLPYLRACIDEAMRLSPPLPGILERRVLVGGAVIDGHVVPEGAVVGVTIYALHHNDKYHPDSSTYLPERFIVGCQTPLFDVTEETLKTSQSAYMPFSVGTRNCIGKNMAYMEMLTTVARLVWLYDMRFARTEANARGVAGADKQRPTEYVLDDIFLSGRYGPIVEFKKRETTEAVI